jgi:hypothetical protein
MNTIIACTILVWNMADVYIPVGEVVSKNYYPGHQYTQIFLLPMGKILMPMPIVQTAPESWTITLRETSNKKEILTQQYRTSRENYENVPIGNTCQVKEAPR